MKSSGPVFGATAALTKYIPKCKQNGKYMNTDGKSYRVIGSEVYYNQINIVMYLYGYTVKNKQI